jgi:hypothetical protein
MAKIRRVSKITVLLLAVSAIVGNTQKPSAYIHEMEQAVLPVGSIKSSSCHNVEISPGSTPVTFVLATGKDERGEVLWSVYSADAIRFSFDMSDLNEDKVHTSMVRSAASISKHQDGTPYPAEDLAIVFILASNQAKKITVHAVDSDELSKLQPNGDKQFAESDMGAKTELRMAVLVPFSDKERAEAFVSALKKAIIACKAQ